MSRPDSPPVLRFLPVALVLLLGAAPLPAATRSLNLFIWSEYIEPGVVAEFERRFDCKVTIDLYEEESAMMAKLQAGGASSYDVAVPPDNKIPVLAKLGLLAPLRLERLPNLRNLEARFLSPPYDPGNRVSVAYHWGTVGLYVRLEGGKPPPATWGLVFDPARQAGPFVLLDGPRDLIGAALKFRGRSLNTFEPGPLKEVRSLLLQAKRRSIGFDNSVGGRNKVLSGAARVAVVYSGEAARGLEEDKETAYLIPREGSQIWVDNLVIPVRAPHPRLGEDFINYLLEPAVAARNARFVRFATANRAARSLLPQEDLGNPAIYPPEAVMESLEFLEDPGKRTRLIDELWTSVKAR